MPAIVTDAPSMTLAQFIAAHALRMDAVRVDSNPNMEDAILMRHWLCTVRMGRKSYKVHFSMGVGCGDRAPALAELLSCLASDAESVHETDFETWAGDFGYSTDSRKAEATFRACERQARKLAKFFGPFVFGDLLECERL